jgi:Tat protein secretion system quality control protein TatD with DNase activity
MPLVLHVRASGEGHKATDALYQRVLGVLQEKVPNSLQGIHIHCFHGDSVTVKLWLNSYPGTYFGFTMMVKGFGERQRLGLKSVPCNRLLLESKSPHLPDVAGSVNHPGGRFGAVKSDSTHHFFGNTCTKSGSIQFSQFSGC